jgi:hypothetical protein
MITDVRQMHSMALEIHRERVHEAEIRRQIRLARAARQGSARSLLGGLAGVLAAIRHGAGARQHVTHS